MDLKHISPERFRLLPAIVVVWGNGQNSEVLILIDAFNLCA